MDTIRQRQAATLDTFKKLLATQMKLDIASAIRTHPHLEGQAATAAYNSLANDTSVNAILSDLAREEVEDSLARGEVPAAAFFHLAGFQPNAIAEG